MSEDLSRVRFPGDFSDQEKIEHLNIYLNDAKKALEQQKVITERVMEERDRFAKEMTFLKEAYQHTLTQFNEISSQLNDRTVMTPIEFRYHAVSLLNTVPGANIYPDQSLKIVCSLIDKIYQESLKVEYVAKK